MITFIFYVLDDFSYLRFGVPFLCISVFKVNPHPDEKERLELSRALNLESRQIKFWFQNKRTQLKVILHIGCLIVHLLNVRLFM